MLKEIVEVMASPIRWLGSRANRVRLMGGRVQVIVMVVTRAPEAMVMLGRSPYHNMWMPPQEGVDLADDFISAAQRCLEVECGLSLPEGLRRSKNLHLRAVRYIGDIPLPSDRVGERPVADDAHGTPMENITLKRKAYWVATIVAASSADVEPVPDGKELMEIRWFPLVDARKLIRNTNHLDKSNLLLMALDQVNRDLFGSSGTLHTASFKSK